MIDLKCTYIFPVLYIMVCDFSNRHNVLLFVLQKIKVGTVSAETAGSDVKL